MQRSLERPTCRVWVEVILAGPSEPDFRVWHPGEEEEDRLRAAAVQWGPPTAPPPSPRAQVAGDLSRLCRCGQ